MYRGPAERLFTPINFTFLLLFGSCATFRMAAQVTQVGLMRLLIAAGLSPASWRDGRAFTPSSPSDTRRRHQDGRPRSCPGICGRPGGARRQVAAHLLLRPPLAS